MEVYVNFDLPPEAEAELRRHFTVVRGGDLSNVEAALVSRLTPDELRKMPRLGFIQAVTAGLDHLPWEHIPHTWWWQATPGPTQTPSPSSPWPSSSPPTRGLFNTARR